VLHLPCNATACAADQLWATLILSQKSTLFDFLAVLRGVFAKEPPVRSRQPQPQPQYNAPAQQGPPPVPPPPAEYRTPVHDRPASSAPPAPSQGPPAPPPKPPKPYEQNRPTPQPQPDRYSQPPPLPPHPPQQPSVQQQRNSWQHQADPPIQGTQHRQGSYDVSPATPISHNSRPYVQTQNVQPGPYGPGSPVSPITPQNQRQVPGIAHQSPLQQPPMNGAPRQQFPQQYGQPPPPQQYQQPAQQYAPRQARPPQQYQQYQQQTPPQPKPAPPVNLLDDTLDVTLPSQQGNQAALPVPPVPPNPQKDALLTAVSQALVSQTQQVVASNQAAVAPLRAQQHALQTAYSRLQAELGELQQLDAVLASNEHILKGAMVEADRAMDDARRRQAPDVDDVLVAPTVVGQQLYTLAAEERGIADALFVLGRALDKGRITADVFVKVCSDALRRRELY
jgi:ESCRT-I complex subunit TSG101